MPFVLGLDQRAEAKEERNATSTKSKPNAAAAGRANDAAAAQGGHSLTHHKYIFLNTIKFMKGLLQCLNEIFLCFIVC